MLDAGGCSSCLLWDFSYTAALNPWSQGKPLYNAIVWQDQRGAPLCESLAAVGGADRFKHKTGRGRILLRVFVSHWGYLLRPLFTLIEISTISALCNGRRRAAARALLFCL